MVGGREPAQSVSQKGPDGPGGGLPHPETGVSLRESRTSRVQPPPAPAPGLASVDAPHPARREGEADKWAHASGQPRDSDPLIGLPEALPRTPSSTVLASTGRRPEEQSPPMLSPRAQVQPDSGQSPACLGHGYITHMWVSHSVKEGLARQKPLCPGPGQGWGQEPEGVGAQRGCCRAA